jgi:hypothetical protein
MVWQSIRSQGERVETLLLVSVNHNCFGVLRITHGPPWENVRAKLPVGVSA